MIGYLDLPSGISGDMFLGCLVDAGWPIDELRRTLESLHLPSGSFTLAAGQVMKGPLRATLVDVKVPEAHGRAHPSSLVLQPAAQGHAHRGLTDIRNIILAADLSADVKEKAIAVFTRLAHAEARVHGTTVEAIHFHEVGALDAIADIVGAVAGVHALRLERLYCSPLPLGGGFVNSAHGQIPLPAPATLELLSAAGAPTCPAPGPGELVTPTGAALIAELASFRQPPMVIDRIAMGAGQKNFHWPNVARLWLGRQIDQADAGSAWAGPLALLETNIDDMNPQFYSAVSDRLFAAGALDVWLTPIQMKKGRPAVMLSVLVPAQLQAAMADLLLLETTTLGVRVRHLSRYQARREFRTVETPHGPVRVKLKYVNDRLISAAPEYEDCRRLAEQQNLPIRQVHDAAVAAAQGLLEITRPASRPHN